MNAATRSVGLLVALLGLLVAGLFAASVATATPYVSGATCSVTDGTPPIGGTDTVNCIDFGGNDSIHFSLHTAVYPLGNAPSNSDGSVSINVQFPNNVAGHHTIEAYDPTTNQLASVDVNIGGSGTGGKHHHHHHGGGTAMTGVAVFTLGGLGVLLLIGGGLFLFAGRRRKAAV